MNNPTPPRSASTPGHELLSQVRRWFAYTRWANARMLTACETLTAEALHREQGTSFGSVFGTLEHMYGADWVWMERWQGRFPSAFPAKGTLRTVDDLRTAWASLDSEREEFLSSLTPARLDEPLAFRNMKGDAFTYPLGSLLLHLSNHGTYHRGQVMQLVRQLGGTVASTDVLFWLAEEK